MSNPVPFLVSGNILDTVVSAKVNYLRVRQNILRKNSRKISLGCCGKYHINFARHFLDIIIKTFVLHKVEHVLIYRSVLLINIAS